MITLCGPRFFVGLAALCVGHALDLVLTPDETKMLRPCPGSSKRGDFTHSNSIIPCTCPYGLRGFGNDGRGYIVSNMSNATIESNGEVEVVTVDVKTANWIRCNNVSVATNIAKLMNIPLKRVTVTPWSWGPQVPQVNYLAFVQESHDRCDCEDGDGRTVPNVGFLRAENSQDRDGAPLNSVPDTSVMTVAQYQALMAAQASQASQASQDVAAAVPSLPPWSPAVPVFQTKEPPPPRGDVQMLTRDPCLVKLLRFYTSWYRQHLAQLLDVPVDKLLLDPPAVEGTVGLLQLDSSSRSQEIFNRSTKATQLPVLAVHECSTTELHERMQGMHSDLALLSEHRQPNYVVNANNMTGAMPLPMNYSVLPPNANASNASNASNATGATLPVTPQRVFLAVLLSNIDYDKFAESWPLINAFEAILKGAIGATGHVPSDAIEMAFFPGSIKVEAIITPPPNTAPAAILAFLNGSVCSEMVGRLNAMVALRPVTTGNISCQQLELRLLDPPFAPEEKNRAWISFWRIVFLPPYAEAGSWRLLNLVNNPNSEVTRLLPLTLARVPGLKDRTVREFPDNAAIETRLPPPLDKALRFKLPNPINEEAALAAEMERMKKEEERADLIIKDKQAAERMQIQRIVKETVDTKEKIQKVGLKIVKAAKAHVAALFNGTGSEAPDIMPWGVLTGRVPDAESPYPWSQQIPAPQVGLLMTKRKVLRR